MEFVMLSDVKKHEFKDLCSKIFERLGYCSDESVYGRQGMGRGLIFTSPTGEKVAVLCLHCLGREVGNDEIRDFRDALFNSPIDRGIIVTTGRLSSDVSRIIAGLGDRVELWDLPKFREMANKAGIKLGEIIYDIQDVAFPAMMTDKVIEYVVRELSNIRGFTSISHTLEIKIEYHPVYRIKYSLTRFGYKSFQIAYIDGSDGKPLPHLSLYDDMPPEPLRRGEQHEVHDFTITPRQAIESLYGLLGERYGRTEFKDVVVGEDFHVAKVSTNHFYVEITSITRVMLPIFNIKIKILNNTYNIKCYTKPPNNIYIINNDLTIYRKSPRGKMAVCNECGGLQGFGPIRGSAKSCWKCWKTICDECATTKKKWLIIPVKYCRTCMEKRIQEEKYKQQG